MLNLAVLWLGSALAALTPGALTLDIQYVDASSEVPEGVTNQLWFTTDTDWLAAQIIVIPDGEGAIFQDAEGNGEQSPNPSRMSQFPSLAFDSYVGNGVIGETVSTVTPVDLGLDEKIWDNDRCAMGWYTSDTDDTGTLKLVHAEAGADNAVEHRYGHVEADGRRLSCGDRTQDRDLSRIAIRIDRYNRQRADADCSRTVRNAPAWARSGGSALLSQMLRVKRCRNDVPLI